MGLLVHYSAPDEIEMANGVATVDTGGGFQTMNARLVSQIGAVSITNPDGNSIAEEAWADQFGGIILGFATPSNLLPLGEKVMTWPTEYRELARMLFLVGNAYEVSTSKQDLVLDFEYKKLQPGILEIKQVREVPSLANTQTIAPYLFNERRTFTSIQMTERDVFTAHRLKSRWTFETRNLQVNASNLLAGLFTNVTVEWINGDRVVTNSLAGLSNLTYSIEGVLPGFPVSTYSWQMNSAVGPANFTLTASHVSPHVSPEFNPIAALSDFRIELSAEYDHPVWVESRFYPFERVRITPLETNSPHEVLSTFEYNHVDGGPTNVTITSRYYIGRNGAYAGEPPLFRFEETRIEGLTSRPLLLRGFFSQSWSGAHRQYAENFLFEPHLEEGMDVALLQELEAKNIRMIYVEVIRWPDFVSGTNRMVTFSTHDGAGP